MRDGWKHASIAHPCPVCRRPNAEHKSRWCSYSTDGAVAFCHWISEGAHRKDPGGYVHFLNGTHVCGPPPCRRPVRSGPIVNWPALTALYCRAMNDDRLCALAFKLGVLPEALSRLHVGLCAPDTWTFPMSDGERIVGIRTRTTDGSEKRSIWPTKKGLFIPTGLRGIDPLLICEGPTDTAAMLSLDFDAIGRADCNHVKYTEKVCKGRCVVIVSDIDEVGMSGADALDRHLVSHGIHARILVPPAKDARAWVNAGALHADVTRAIVPC